MARRDPPPVDGPSNARIGIVGDRKPGSQTHLATEAALAHLPSALPFEWVPTDAVPAEAGPRLSGYAGLLIAPGSPYRSMEGALAAIRYARENRVPLLGTCGGFQHLVVEFARNVLGIRGADHEETNPGAPRLAITALACSLAGQSHLVRFAPGSKVAALYRAVEAVEPFFCSYGLSAGFKPLLEARGLSGSGTSEDGETRVLELAGHPFFLGTLYVPQARSKPGEPHPLVRAFVAAARGRTQP